MKLGVGFVIASAILAPHAQAYAATCGVIEEKDDGLSESDRKALRTLLLESLKDEGLEVVEAPCEDTFTVQHIKLGKRITVVMSRGEERRRGRANSLEELPHVYSQMVKAIIAGRPMGEQISELDRTNVTNDQVVPRRAKADSLWYVRLGPGSTIGGKKVKVGPSFGFGYRYELNRLGIDASFNFQINDTQGETDQGGNFTWAKLLGLYFFDPTSNSTPYLGGGISWGGSGVEAGGGTYTGTGLQGEIVGGYELLRASTIRMFVQADATLPFYQSKGGSGATGEKYTPTFALSFGLAWGGDGDTINVRQVD